LSLLGISEKGELVVMSLDLNSFGLPESVPCSLRFVFSAIHVTLKLVLKITRLSRFGGCKFVNTPRLT